MMTERTRQLQEDRRFFHRLAEPGWFEFKTTLQIAKRLKDAGWALRLGHSAHAGERLGAPAPEECQAWIREHYEKGELEALFAELNEPASVFEEITQGYTGLIAEWDSGKPGPFTVLRFDIDALLVPECREQDHLPAKYGFASRNPQTCHACGHDAHITMGLATAERLVKDPRICGRFLIFFQPAEESARGAHSMLRTGLMDGADYFISGHIGMTEPSGRIGVGTTGFLATRKFDISLFGRESHAGMWPEEGRNALLGACHMVTALYSLPQFGAGMSRINAGQFHCNSASNVVAGRTDFSFEFRGGTNAICDKLEEKVMHVVNGITEAYGLEKKLSLSGAAPAFDGGDEAFYRDLYKHLESCGYTLDGHPDFKASEDVTLYMNACEAGGGEAIHFLFGTKLAAGHHNPRFDIDENDIENGCDVVFDTLLYLCTKDHPHE